MTLAKVDKAVQRHFSEEAVMTRLKERVGFQYQSAQLAAYFGIPTARMTEVLIKLVGLKLIRRVRCGGNPTMYYVPTSAQLAAEAALAARGL
ncbi:hypothetical protein [Herminiimonas contaminans]|uniref:Uncharacterized protein n=1 Tax=Herminiimonas contaminans TaxID=1111140 RepID=A0ABS0EXE8_9BURK|nr:hypothetical protein [Herminiimonas contaminans]MBF8177823.1 hypothetical protein [Herminiimonas contaminans]